MSQTYYNPNDLKKFGSIGEFSKPLADKFFGYYGEVFAEGELSAREKSLIALAVAHAVQCPYCGCSILQGFAEGPAAGQAPF